MKYRLRTRVFAWLWIGCLQFFIVQVAVASQWHTPFHLALNYISDLGAMRCANYPVTSMHYVCSPWHNLMNASMMFQGLLIAGGAALRPTPTTSRWIETPTRVALLLAAIGSVIVGAFPEDALPNVHYVGAALHLLTANIALLLLGLATKRERPEAKPLITLLWIAGVAGLMTTILLPLGLYGGLGVGTIERIAVYPLPICLFFCGATALSPGGNKQTTPR